LHAAGGVRGVETDRRASPPPSSALRIAHEARSRADSNETIIALVYARAMIAAAEKAESPSAEGLSQTPWQP